ncbi:hypothetical protein B0T20DRAFT_162425 [Sordaria brevicollis]|uniref:RNase MRP protein 1 RNA binding domain-containing protein n=1 Tax=Sordaria brevicollis TaxID=83679 RepID=A0AAE0PJL1_SORBR|nr:hypothetical protein B0T20DRAFT_162425 [Sordaria brevicollis]
MNRNPGSKPNSKPSSKAKQKLTNNPRPTSTTQQPPSSKPSEPEPPTTTISTLSSLPPSISNDPSSLLPILTPAFEILSRFHHRNKNQHRLSKWWAEADMLRRHLRKLIEAANEWCDKEPEREARRRKEEQKRKKREKNERLGRFGKVGEDDEGKEGEDDKELEEVRVRAEYLRGTLGPRAYFAFSQLTADRQFAHLGLMLLGVLAQVDKALSVFASIPIDNDDGAVADEAAEDASTAVNATSDAPKQQHNDTGVAVSREELLAMMSAPGSGTPVSRDGRDQPLPTTEIENEGATEEGRKVKAKSGKKRPSDDEDTSVPEKKVKKKRKTEGDGDDMDDIFASFNKLKKAKKEKRAMTKQTEDGDGDDIDEIFASFDKPFKKKKTTTTMATATTTLTTSETATTTATQSTTKLTTTTVESSAPTKAPVEAEPEPEPEAPQDDLNSIFASLEKPKKKKPKEKKTDDLDDIFAAFDKPTSSKSTKIKKKKRTGAGADEFDDIFGGL